MTVESREPTPQQKIAYHDGELSGPERAQVEAWLAQHPSAAAELDSWRRLDEVYRTAEPPEPAADAWAAVLEGVAAGRAVLPMKPRRVGGKRWPWIVGLGAAAAAVLLMSLWMGRSAPGQLVEPFPVAENDDVNIISMDGNDTALVAAPPPVEGDLVVTGPSDFKLKTSSESVAEMRVRDIVMIADAGWNEEP